MGTVRQAEPPLLPCGGSPATLCWHAASLHSGDSCLVGSVSYPTPAGAGDRASHRDGGTLSMMGSVHLKQP